MIVTYNWLKEFVDIDLPADDVAHRLTMAGLEVESVDEMGKGLESVVVARLDEVGQHPGADRLTLCQVNNGSEVFPVVCGAQNHKKGDLIAFAQVGSVLPGDFKIKKSKIRGEVSLGMLCSEKELGLADEADGIMILPADLALGQPVFEQLGLTDVRFEIGLTPNRPDCLSLVGVAREIAALTNTPLRLPSAVVSEGTVAIEEVTSVTIEEPELCPRYTARVIQGVKIGPSPDWLVRKVESVGMRSINNVVDVTNFLMMELGQPMHAFDFTHLRGGKIVVKTASDGDTFNTLDDQEHVLSGSDLVICDGEGPVALAGVMGGQNSEVSEETTDILLESAYFTPNTIRRTARRLGLHTESSHRFERGTDVDMARLAVDRGAALIAEVAGGAICKGVIDAYPARIVPLRLAVGTRKTNKVLGTALTSQRINTLLTSIGLHCAESDGDCQTYEIPTFRPDLEREIDLIEEVARLEGYDQIPTTMPSGMTSVHRPDRRQALSKKMRELMVGAGFKEVINYSFFSPKVFDQLQLAADDARRKTIAVLNPLTEDQSVMRTTLVACTLETLRRNLCYNSSDLQLFELRPVFTVREGDELPVEELTLCGSMLGRRSPVGWSASKEGADFYDLKGVVEELLSSVGLNKIAWDSEMTESYYHPGKSCAIKVGKQVIGYIGEIHPLVADAFEVRGVATVFELNAMRILELIENRKISFKALSRFPDISRDNALLIDESVTSAEIMRSVNKAKSPDVEDSTIFDIYRGQGVPEGKKSVAIRIKYRSMTQTLTDEEITKAHSKIISALINDFSAEVR